MRGGGRGARGQRRRHDRDHARRRGLPCARAGPGGPLRLPAPHVEVLDTSGAGDVFCGCLAGGLARGMSAASGAEARARGRRHRSDTAGHAVVLPFRVGNRGAHRSNGALMTQPSRPIGQSSGDALVQLFGRTKVVIGVVHLAPLPGAPRYDGEAVEAIYQRGLDDARSLSRWRMRRRHHREPWRHSRSPSLTTSDRRRRPIWRWSPTVSAATSASRSASMCSPTPRSRPLPSPAPRRGLRPRQPMGQRLCRQ